MATAHSNAARQCKRKLVLYFTLLWTTRVLVSIKGFKGRVYPPLWAYKHLQRRRLWSVRRYFVQKYVTRFAQTPVLPNAVKDRKMETSISKSGETPPRIAKMVPLHSEETPKEPAAIFLLFTMVRFIGDVQIKMQTRNGVRWLKCLSSTENGDTVLDCCDMMQSRILQNATLITANKRWFAKRRISQIYWMILRYKWTDIRPRNIFTCELLLFFYLRVFLIPDVWSN